LHSHNGEAILKLYGFLKAYIVHASVVSAGEKVQFYEIMDSLLERRAQMLARRVNLADFNVI
jgi:hypothetical protein